MRVSAMLGAGTLAALLSFGSVEAVDLEVYFNNFDGTETFGGGATGALSGVTTTAGVAGFSGLGVMGNQFSGNMLRNTATGNPAAPTVLTLTNLPAHTSLDVSFLLPIIDSWDSSTGSFSPDFFNVHLDGAQLLQDTYNNAFLSESRPSDTTGTDIGMGCVQRGFGGRSFDCDRAFDTSTEAALNVAHTASTATISFFASGGGWQGGGDESWGLENLRVVINAVDGQAVPEPMTLTLLGVGMLGLAVSRSRRR